MIQFILNNQMIKTGKPSGSLLLDFIRYEKTLTGTKVGCREGDCGACTVLIGRLIDGQMDYKQVTSCLTPIGNVDGKHVVTIEGLNMEELTPVQQCMVDESGTQCGFCTVGFVVSMTGFCLANSEPSHSKAINAIDGNICRCTGYKSIERAAYHLTEAVEKKKLNEPVQWLVDEKFIPNYFKEIPERLEKLKQGHPQSQNQILVGGGTDLYVQKMDELIDGDVSSIAQIPDLKFIKIEKGVCTLGAGNTATDLLESEEMLEIFPHLENHMKLVASSPIRNMATLGGNFVNASPIADFTAFFLALNAKITLDENNQTRTIYLKDFYKGYKDLDKTPKEIITTVSFNVPTPNSYFNFEKVSKRIHLDIASVNSAIQITLEKNKIRQIHCSVGGVAPIPLYVEKTCSFLIGKKITSENIVAANEVLQSEISPISDIRGSADYKRLLLRQLFFAHFIHLFPHEISLDSLT